jgi:hypothetical protein
MYLQGFKGNGASFSLNSHSNVLFFYFQTKSNGACMETSNLSIQPYQSKFILLKVKANKNFRKFIRFFQTCLDPNKFSPNSKAV